MQLNDDILCRAAALVRDKRMNSLSEYEEYPVHEFSEAFETEMQGLMDKLGKGEITPYKVSMGWQYYARHGLVAVLVCILLTCFAAPQAVMAGYQKLIEVIETITEEYTLFQYTTTDTNEVGVFEPIKIVLPDEFVLKREILSEESAHWTYVHEDNYFIIVQNLITSDEMAVVMDSEDAVKELLFINSEEITLYLEEDICRFVWTAGKYQLHGHSNLDRNTVLAILESIQYDALHYNAEHQMNKVFFGYLPEGLEITEESSNETLYYVLYQGKNQYFCLEQRLLLEDTELTQIIDTEDAYVEQKRIQNEMAILSLKDGVYTYTWIYKNYQISGISNLSGEEMIKILESIQ